MAKRYDIGEHRRRRQLEPDRGREAASPQDIPRKGWRDVLLRTKSEMARDNLSLIAAGVGFYALLSIFPAIAAAISLWGLFADPAAVEAQMSAAVDVMPGQAADILRQQMHTVASQPSTGLGLGLIIGLALAFWSAAKGTRAMMQGLNIVYDEDERRGFIRLNATALLLTVSGILAGVLALAAVAVLPALLGLLGLPAWIEISASVLRWPLVLVVVVLALAITYRYGPSRRPPKWRWVSPGAALATVGWLIVSVAFSLYVSNFGSYGATYGSVGAVVVLMMWFYLSAYVALMGAELDAELERQTRRDSTRGPQRPMGERDAYAADTLGPSP